MSGALDAIIWALALGLCAAMCWISFGTSRVHAAEYEILAERAGGALLREDEPNSHRLRAKDEEPFASHADCMNVITAKAIDFKLGSGWRLRCRPVDVPLPRMVVR